MKTKLSIFLIVILAAVLRIYNLVQKNLWFDEVYSWKISQSSLKEIIIKTSGDIHPPLFYILLKFWMNIFSESIFAMRMLSVLFGILSMYFIYKISKLFLKNDFQAIVVFTLYAVSPLNIYYSQEARMLNLNLFLCLGSVYFFFCLINSPSKKDGILYFIFTFLAIYTHYFAFLILFTEIILILVFYFYQKLSFRILKLFIFYVVLLNLLYLPWYPTFFQQISKGQPWRTEQTLMQVGLNILDYLKEVFFSVYYIYESSAVYYFARISSILLVVFIIYSIYKLIRTKLFLSDLQTSISFLFLIPLIIASLISFNQSIVLSRYLSILVPYLLITLVYFSFKIYKTKVAVIIVVFLFLISCYGTYINFDNGFKNNDYRKIITFLENNYNKGDKLIVEPHYMGWGIDYYLQHNNSAIQAPSVLGWNLNMQLDSLNKISNINNVWVVLDYSALEKENYDSISSIMEKIGYVKENEKMFYVMPAKVKVQYYRKQGIH